MLTLFTLTCEARDSMHSSPNANIDSGCQAVSIATGNIMFYGVETSRWSHPADFVGHSVGALSCFYCRVHFYLHNDRNIRTSILLMVGIINVFCWSLNYVMALHNECVGPFRRQATSVQFLTV